jgi:ribokinase
MSGSGTADVIVAGQIARDLVLVVDDVPGAGQSAAVRQRREMLGGKGANQAVALAQLGMRVALLGVVGDDDAGQQALDQARADGIDVSAVQRRDGTATGLVVDVVDRAGRWHYLEDLPPSVLLTEADVAAAASLFAGARWVSIQLQQPPEAALAAARRAREAGGKIALDGAPADGEHHADLLALADVVRADAREAAILTQTPAGDASQAREAAAGILRRGPSVVALAVDGTGNLVAWPGGDLLIPLTDTPVADTTGAGDAFMAALITALDRGDDPARAGRLAVAAAGATVGHPGGRPALTRHALDEQLALLDH